MKQSSFDATISALDAETSALDVETSALDVETSAFGGSDVGDRVEVIRCDDIGAGCGDVVARCGDVGARRGDVGDRAELPAISAPRRGVYGDIGDCGVGITPQMCNRVTNHGDMSTFSKPAVL